MASSLPYKKTANGEREHRVIAGAVGRGENVVVDHRDGNPRNNARSNLKVMSRAAHAVKTHRKYSGLLKCKICGKAFRPGATHRDGSTLTCSKACASRQMSRSAKRRRS